MRRTEALSIAEVVQQALSRQGLDKQMLEHRAAMIWPDVVGAVINRQTLERRVDKGVMYVRIISAPMRNELMMQRSSLIEALNRRLDAEVITDIKFI